MNQVDTIPKEMKWEFFEEQKRSQKQKKLLKKVVKYNVFLLHAWRPEQLGEFLNAKEKLPKRLSEKLPKKSIFSVSRKSRLLIPDKKRA